MSAQQRLAQCHIINREVPWTKTMLQIKKLNDFVFVCERECVWVDESKNTTTLPPLSESIQQLHNTPPWEWDSLTVNLFTHHHFYLVPVGSFTEILKSVLIATILPCLSANIISGSHEGQVLIVSPRQAGLNEGFETGSSVSYIDRILYSMQLQTSVLKTRLNVIFWTLIWQQKLLVL